MPKNFFEELKWRGLIQDSTPIIDEELDKNSLTAYIGFDPTSDSLHIGSLVQLIILKHFQEYGHKPILLIGGATAMIGDPSGKSKERNLLDQNEIYKNHFEKVKETGSYIIMDNSLHELGEAYDHERLRYWVSVIEPDEFIVPDVWMRCAETAAQAKYWKQFKYPKKTKLTAVIQGKDKNDAYLCANLLTNLGYKKLCVSYGATWYNDFYPHSNPDMGKALGRIRFVQGLLALDHLKDVNFHLLGCSIPQEFGWYDNNPRIESIDTSNPIMAALEGNLLWDNGLNKKPIEYIIDGPPLQKWNNMVINYDGGHLDIFMNSKLIRSFPSVVPYMSFDQLTVGEENGLGGGICNVVYFPSSISRERIITNYNLLKNNNPPII